MLKIKITCFPKLKNSELKVRYKTKCDKLKCEKKCQLLNIVCVQSLQHYFFSSFPWKSKTLLYKNNNIIISHYNLEENKLFKIIITNNIRSYIECAKMFYFEFNKIIINQRKFFSSLIFILYAENLSSYRRKQPQQFFLYIYF